MDETEQPLEAQRSVTDTCDVLRVNHYFTRSEEERFAKLHRPRAGGGELRPEVIRAGQGIREDRRFGVDGRRDPAVPAGAARRAGARRAAWTAALTGPARRTLTSATGRLAAASASA